MFGWLVYTMSLPVTARAASAAGMRATKAAGTKPLIDDLLVPGEARLPARDAKAMTMRGVAQLLQMPKING